MEQRFPYPFRNKKDSYGDSDQYEKLLHIFLQGLIRLVRFCPSTVAQKSTGLCAGRKAITYSDLRHQDIGGGRGINAQCAAADLDHALLPSALAEQFQFRSRQDP